MCKTVTVKEFEAGLDYRKGRFVGVLPPGRYRIWPFSGREIVRVDMREFPLQITGQEVLTTDQVAVRLNVLVRMRVADPALALHTVVSYTDATHQVVQLVLRETVATLSLEEVLTRRAVLGGELTAAAAPRAAEFGVTVTGVAIKDAMVNSELKAAYEAKLVAEQKGQAALIAARHQVAAARAQANAAKVLEENPALLAQRQLDVLDRAATAGYGNHFVVLPEVLGTLARALTARRPAPPTGDDPPQPPAR